MTEKQDGIPFANEPRHSHEAGPGDGDGPLFPEFCEMQNPIGHQKNNPSSLECVQCRVERTCRWENGGPLGRQDAGVCDG